MKLLPTPPIRRRLLAWTTAAAVLGSVCAPAAAADAPAGAAPAASVAPGVVINEVEASNWAGEQDDSDKPRDWAELYNPTASSVDVSYWGLSNKDGARFRWVFPEGTVVEPGDYLTVWLSKDDVAIEGEPLATDFNLDNGADETLYLSIPDGTATGALVDSVTPPRTKTGVSWCRATASTSIPAGTWAHCAEPTFGEVNSGAMNTTMTAEPTFSLSSGLFATSQTVSLAGPAGATIRYTQDGSEPTATSSAYSSPLTVSSSTTIRAAAFAAGAESSFVATSTYVVDAAAATKYAGQRTIMVSMSPKDVSSYNAMSKSRSFASAVEMRESDGTLILKTDAESEVAGQLGSRHGQDTAAMDIALRDSRGQKEFTYPLTPQKGEQTFDRFRLRNGGSEWWSARLRDSFAQSLMADSPSLYSDYAPVTLFVNGEYRGLMDIREREDETLVESSTGADADSVDYLSDGDEKSGGKEAEDAWSDFERYISRTDMSVAANYEAAKQQIDVENLAAVSAFYGWSAIWDWPWRNVNTWRSSALDGTWQYQVHDFDISMDSPDHAYHSNTKATVDMYGGSGIYSSGNTVFARMMKNTEFRNLFINTVADQFNDQLRASTANARLDQMVAQVEPYIGTFRAWQPSMGSAAAWKTTDVARLRAFVAAREGVVDTQTQKEFGLTARQPLSLATNDSTMGSVSVNSIDSVFDLGTTTWSGRYYPQVPVTVTAHPKPGYVFVGWQGADTSSAPALTRSITSATSLTAVFAPGAEVLAPVVDSIAAQTSTTGDHVDVSVTATDPVGADLVYSATKLPKGLSIDPASGRITGRVYTTGESSVTITASNGVVSSSVTVPWTVVDRPGTGILSGPVTGLVRTEWFTNKALSGTPFIVDSSAIGVNAPTGVSPRPTMPSSSWSVRWSATLTPTVSGSYAFHSDSTKSDGVRVVVGGTAVIDDWGGKNLSNDASVELTAGVPVELRVEFFDAAAAASLALTWKAPGSQAFTSIPATVLTDEPVAAQTPAAAPVASAPPVEAPGAPAVPAAPSSPTDEPTAAPTATATASATPEPEAEVEPTSAPTAAPTPSATPKRTHRR